MLLWLSGAVQGPLLAHSLYDLWTWAAGYQSRWLKKNLSVRDQSWRSAQVDLLSVDGEENKNEEKYRKLNVVKKINEVNERRKTAGHHCHYSLLWQQPVSSYILSLSVMSVWSSDLGRFFFKNVYVKHSRTRCILHHYHHYLCSIVHLKQ